MLMATFDFTKGISGKIGNTVFYVTKDGTQVVRSHVKPKNPRTPKQQASRARFALVNKELRHLANAIRGGNPRDPNAYRSAIGKACKEAVAGEYPDLYIDYSKIQVASGELQTPRYARVKYDAGARTAYFEWDPQRADAPSRGRSHDRVFIVLHNTDMHVECSTIQKGIRGDGKASIELPERWQVDTTHFWLYLTTLDFQESSRSIYLKPK